MKNSIHTSLLTTRDLSMCAPRVTRHTSIRYSSSCHTQASIWAHRYSSLLQWSASLGQRCHVERILCTDLLCDIATRKTTSSPPGALIFHYINSHRLAAEMWTTMNNKLLGEEYFCVVHSICTGLVNTCPSFLL